MGGSQWRWFGVRTLHRTRVAAPPHDPEQPTLVEVRVLLVKAPTPAAAIRRAARHNVTAVPFRNMLGQEMRSDDLGASTSYELFDDDARRLGRARGPIEVFSDTHLVLAGEPDSAVILRFSGGPIDAHERSLRLRLFVPDAPAHPLSRLPAAPPRPASGAGNQEQG